MSSSPPIQPSSSTPRFWSARSGRMARRNSSNSGATVGVGPVALGALRTSFSSCTQTRKMRSMPHPEW